MSSNPSPLVLVTGGSGYIAGWLIIALLKANYRVRTTLRSLSKAATVRAALVEHTLVTDSNLSFVQVDLTSDEGWDAAVSGCDFVQHVASPLGVVGDNSKDLVTPAREGTLRVLRACVKARVQRVVLTSSIAACQPPVGRNDPQDTMTGDEVWTDVSGTVLEYFRSKTLAEQAAWEFMETSSSSTTMVAVLPGFCIGRSLNGKYSESMGMIARMLSGKMPGAPRVGFTLVDTQDVVDLQVLVMVERAATGRYIAASQFLWLSDIVSLLRINFPANSSKLPSRTIPNWLVRVLAYFRGDMAFIARRLDLKREFVIAKAKALGWQPRPSKEAVVECAKDLINKNLV